MNSRHVLVYWTDPDALGFIDVLPAEALIQKSTLKHEVRRDLAGGIEEFASATCDLLWQANNRLILDYRPYKNVNGKDIDNGVMELHFTDDRRNTPVSVWWGDNDAAPRLAQAFVVVVPTA